MERKGINIIEGKLFIDGKQRILISGDYPYYRDNILNWEKKIKKIKELGIDIITFYIPWRHHITEKTATYLLDKEGSNKNLIYFIKLAKKYKLYCIIKPGPFIHGEVPIGGLPDYVTPKRNKNIEPITNYEDKPLNYIGDILPSPLSEEFYNETSKWFSILWERVIEKNIYPNGPIIGVQIGNEGMYSQVNQDVRNYDYSNIGIKRFREFLKREYVTIEQYNIKHRTSYLDFEEINPPREFGNITTVNSLLEYIDWGRWIEYYLSNFYEMYSNIFDNRVIKLVNVNPPSKKELFNGEESKEYDSWLTRIVPENYKNVNYGYTNWAGNAIYDDDAFNRIVFTSKRFKGPNIEDNWGHVWTDKTYGKAITPIFHSVLLLASGSTGFNVYNICTTEEWDDNLKFDGEIAKQHISIDNFFEPPYCEEAPIRVDGSKTHKYDALKLFTKYLNGEDDLLNCTERADICLGIYVPYSQVTSWSDKDKLDNNILAKMPLSASDGLIKVMKEFIEKNISFKFENLETIALNKLSRYKNLIFFGGFFLSEEVQNLLCSYVEKGGNLIVLWDIPKVNQYFQKCTIFQEKIFPDLEKDKEDFRTRVNSEDDNTGYNKKIGKGKAIYFNLKPNKDNIDRLYEEINIKHGRIIGEVSNKFYVSEFENKAEEVKYIFIINRDEKSQHIFYHVENDELKILLEGKCFSILKIRNRKIESCYIKGVNEITSNSKPIHIEFNEDIIKTNENCDAIVKLEKEQYKIITGTKQYCLNKGE